MYLKIHRAYRNVVALCDKEIIGKRFEEGKRQLDLKENFYKGEEVSEEDAIKTMKIQMIEDATFNIVGKNSIALAIKSGLIKKEDVSYIQKIPFTLVLL